MKQELIKKLTPVIDQFADKILDTFKDVYEIRKNLINQQREFEALTEAKEKEIADIREKRYQEKIDLDKRVYALETKTSECVSKMAVYDRLIKDVNDQKETLKKDQDEALLTLARAKDTETQAKYLKEESEKIKKQYDLKLDSLKIDTDRLTKDREQIELDRKIQNNKAKDNNVKEAQLNQLALDLNEQEKIIKFERQKLTKGAK